MSNFIVKKVAVLGAGVMGAQIAAHCINAKVPVVLFDLPAKEGPKNGIVQRAIENLKKLSPAPLANKDDAALIQVANYEDDIELLKGCDLIIEAIAERMDWKHDLYKKVAPHIAPNAIFASNTSGLSITALSDGFDAELKARFCGVHFFNPPRYMHLVELIPTATTNPEILNQLEAFLTTTLGKGVVRAFDTPNFVANRVGVFGILATAIEAEKYGLSVDVVDDLTGAKLGRAKSGTFRTADVVGLDTMGHVIKTMQDNLKDDPFFSSYATPPLLAKLVEQGALGQKSGAGFYKKVGKDILRIDPAKGDYVPGGGKADDIIARILKEKDPVKRMKALHDSTNPQGQFLWAIFRDAFHYIAVHLETVADNARDLDFAMRWGFGWSVGPFETWQASGWQQVATWIKEDIDAGKALSTAPLPAWVFDGREGVHSAQGSYSPSKKTNVARSELPVYQRQAFRAPLVGEGAADGKTAGTTFFEDDSVRIWHQNDDVLILSFKTKMHVIGQGVIDGINKALDEAEKNFKGLVIWHADAAEGGAFSAGADLQSMLPLFMSGGVKAIEPVVHHLQQAHQRLKYANVPVVAAVAGLALGGGCELLLHAAKRVASIESYIGLVEVGVGLIPAGGGLKEAAVRAAKEAKGNDILQFLKDYMLAAATANVSKSALEARKLGYLKADDVIVFNPYELLHVAKVEARAMFDAGYRPALAPQVPVVGRYGVGTIMAQLVNMRDGGFISAHDFKLGQMIAEIVSGGEVEEGSVVNEQWLLDLERKAFMELLNHPKTQERIMGMMQTGKPVRN
ncbi:MULTISPECIES: 3-hydroxyacyl-CoA dehydrogenase NAD-binding domain-containing protein [unclassified Herbaspirillum]|uniref:3-hydroxyacyl-CoA dehydrogenase/enoyl-CoA hydratase family protein n=1 Tax=unclassified Herbaspirillum TaxID=2624150 RepID=UPI000E2E9ED3|nr:MULTISPECIES: 3-hydroxyacyl-CoA dehydrogenase NAD-binding domain-containing protein [unclassified Herbaspirillum]RFB65554.1 3-hydroxyacyl-CoA dehydrogenase/enoyl-CoA hydratase family protein [Herbaspirillum sp. 3R-3a1]TFI08187.1 3-hydroxyacyl-CoA dehydrogenase/enoyl-CoA hydratase family protein [Herbaspirillum sp. 3R11]TFI14602.1 3-hydroxyacyl-CoA dehydrogenase/enoyl-CoA hydratase family protein [Herbaspirillum sp. 3R-11]TFI24669.1 3-hydroxyacyl-CoA dehydrogenase/enoyl-CoA hydratase family p